MPPGFPGGVYVDPGMPFSITGMIHTPRLSKQFATRFSTHDDFFADAERGRLAAYSFIEPNLLHAHNDYHPAYNALMPGLAADPPSSILGGEELLARVYSAIRGSSTAGGSNFANTLFLVSFDEHGGTFDHVPPPRVPPPDPAAGAGQMGFRFDRSGVRIPTLAVSAYLDPRTVVTGEYRNTSVIRTLRERFSLGPPPDRPRRRRRRHRPRPHPGHPPRPGGLARGHRPAGAATGRPAGLHGPATAAARQVPPRHSDRPGHHAHRAGARHRPHDRHRPASPRLHGRPASQNLARPDQIARRRAEAVEVLAEELGAKPAVGDGDQGDAQHEPVASKTMRCDERDAKHASIPLRRVRAGELRWEKFLYELKAGPAGAQPPTSRLAHA